MEKVEKVGLATFSTTQAVLEAQIVENVGQANFLHHFRDLQRLLQKFVEKVAKLGLANTIWASRASFFNSH